MKYSLPNEIKLLLLDLLSKETWNLGANLDLSQICHFANSKQVT